MSYTASYTEDTVDSGSKDTCTKAAVGDEMERVLSSRKEEFGFGTDGRVQRSCNFVSRRVSTETRIKCLGNCLRVEKRNKPKGREGEEGKEKKETELLVQEPTGQGMRQELELRGMRSWRDAAPSTYTHSV